MCTGTNAELARASFSNEPKEGGGVARAIHARPRRARSRDVVRPPGGCPPTPKGLGGSRRAACRSKLGPQ